MNRSITFFPVFFLLVLLGQFPGKEVLAQTTQEQLKQMRSTVIEKQEGKDYIIHTIKRGQTLYMISKAYNVDINEIIQLNPQVREGIRQDQKIRIPMAGRKTLSKTVVPPPVKTDTVPVAELPCGSDNTTKKPVYNVALMLPLFLGEVDHINTENPDAGILENSKSFQFLPFYEGFRMAVDSLEKTGLKIKLFVYDVDKDTTRTRQILRKPEMKSMDLIIGLLYTRNFQIVAEFAEKNKINIVNPISERSELVYGNPYVIKVQPSKKARFDELAKYMEQSFTHGQILILRNGQYSDKDAPERLKKACQERKLNVLVIEGQEAAITKISKEQENYLVAFTDNPAYALDLSRRLFELHNDYNITLVGLPDWATMEGLETEYLVALKTVVITPVFIDYDDPDVKKFVSQYQSVYHADPVLLGFQGFDAACYFLSALKKFGTNSSRCLGDLKINSLQTDFEFIRTKGNGFENQHWEIYRYGNYKLIKAN